MAGASRFGMVAAAGLAACAASAWAQPDVMRAREVPTRYDGWKVVRVEIRNAADFRAASALSDDIYTEHPRLGRPIDMRVSPEQFAAVLRSGLRFSILDHNIQATIDAEAAAIRAHQNADDPSWYLTYHNYEDVKAYVQALAAQYPNLAAYEVIGQSLQGRDIFALRITGPGSTADRPASLWWGGQHAREWINVPVPIYHAEQLLTRYSADPHIRFIVDHTETIIVPIMNPDGYDYTWTNNRLWRKNRRNNAGAGFGCNNFGVDLNRNWGYQWGGQGSSGQCNSETYRGAAPFSEPETQVMRDFIIANPRIRASMDWHSFGQHVMSPWGYTSALPTPAGVAQQFQSLDDQMAAAILATHGTAYDAGPVYTTIYPAAGVSVDWCFGARGIWAFTIELRDTGQFQFELPADQIVPTCEETYNAFLALQNFITPCYANCDGSTGSPALNVNDFVCFQNQFAAGDSRANCDLSSDPPVLNVNDFVCFQNTFAAGCP